VTQLPSTTQLLQTTLKLIPTIKQGTITLKTNNTENIQLTTENNKTDLNILQKDTLKTLLELQTQDQEETILKKLTTLKNIAETLKQNNLTITISYQGDKLVTIGYKATPTLSQAITGTDAIEINNPIKLTELLT